MFRYGVVQPPIALKTRLSKPLPPLPQAGDELENEPQTVMDDAASYYTPRSPTWTCPSSLAGSPPSSIRSSISSLEDVPREDMCEQASDYISHTHSSLAGSPPSSIRNSIAGTLEDEPWSGTWERALYYTPRTPISSSPSTLCGSPPSSIRNSIASTLEAVPWTAHAHASIYTPLTPTSTSPSPVVGSPPMTLSLTPPPNKACPHDAIMCYECMRHDPVYRDELAHWGCQRNKAIYWLHQQAMAEGASRPVKKGNWLARLVVRGQTKK